MEALLWTVLLSVAVVVLVWWGLRRHLFRPLQRLRHLFRPLQRLTEGADRLARGERAGPLELPGNEPLATLAVALNSLSDRVGEQLAQVRSERNRLQEILASMSDGILVTDEERRVWLVNPAFRSLFDIGAVSDGRGLLETTRQPGLESLVERCEVEAAVVTEDSLPLDNGRVLVASASPVSTGGVLVLVHDVTERVHLAETRRDFVANVSHEIKTPLTAIRGLAETLREGALSEPQTAVRFTERILGQCARLEALLADLLPLARMEGAEEQGIEFGEVDLDALIRRAVEDVMPTAEARGVTVELDLADGLPGLVGDPESLNQLVLNLLNNGVKYNREGGSVRLRARHEPGRLLIEVEDSGIGMPTESISRIFERFYRVDKGRARDEGGTGLGLALVKHAVRLHGGQIEVESQLGVGSTFRVTLPLDGDGAANL